MKIEMTLTGVDGLLKTLKSLPPEIVSKRGGPVKLALAKGARFLRDKAKANLTSQIAKNGDESTGLLLESVISSRGKQPFDGKGERYLVRVKRKSYNKGKGGKVTTLQTANLLEYGSEHQPATPWLRPALNAHGRETINIVVDDLKIRIDKVIAKLAQQNSGKT
jgi:HK97 gp10 family phage protein